MFVQSSSCFLKMLRITPLFMLKLDSLFQKLGLVCGFGGLNLLVRNLGIEIYFMLGKASLILSQNILPKILLWKCLIFYF